ncbi:MAG: hypothetical protein PHR35_13070 [Kiritimatiellae bacterium]|nr:hypothetical protein [Kiritimatiellia bacterium]
MDRFWKWLMRMDARGIFLISLLLFLAAVGWRGWAVFHPARTPAPAPAPVNGEPLKLPAFRELGAIGFVSNQFSADALVVPVNPFRPTFEAMVSNEASVAMQTLQTGGGAAAGGAGSKRTIRIRRPKDEQPAQPPTAAAQPAVPPTPPPVVLTYRGMLQRPDGTIAVYLHDSRKGGGRFAVIGDKLYGAEVAAVHQSGVTLRLPDGSDRTLGDGDAVTLPGEAP